MQQLRVHSPLVAGALFPFSLVAPPLMLHEARAICSLSRDAGRSYGLARSMWISVPRKNQYFRVCAHLTTYGTLLKVPSFPTYTPLIPKFKVFLFELYAILTKVDTRTPTERTYIVSLQETLNTVDVSMWTPQQKAFCVLSLAEHRSIIRVQRLFRRQYNLRPREAVPTIIGPYFFAEKTVTANTYLDMLQLYAVPQLPDGAIFQQDGAPPHFANMVRTFLDEQFPARWIGRGSPYITWPARSPDLTPPDFFLWGFVKDQVYRTPVRDLADLQERIYAAVNNVTPQMLHNTWVEVEYRLDISRATNGSHVEVYGT
ncbi:hypothetical protein ANN_12177 [Periplaneta americana]|uniref:DUF4817 domain-containing protein n=1 Tax=Periplaneta americana TaxID=6978 RepID=A0ABQ8T8I2_PERAM|nr:hypothetical protein ANN_12177 [Periplaneta americana]